MTRFLLTLTALAATLLSVESTWAEKPAPRQPIAYGPNGASGDKLPGFIQKGKEGLGLFGPAGRVVTPLPTVTPAKARRPPAYQAPTQRATIRRSSFQRSVIPQPNFHLPAAQQFGAAGAFIPPVYSSPWAARPQARLQVPYPSQGFVDVEYDDGSTGRVLMGNPANSFAPAGAFGFGPGAIYGW
jgi:hypothetical protein